MLSYDDRKKLIGERIKTEREKAGLSKPDLLKNIYMSTTSHKSVTAWESGEILPSLDNLSRMAELFKCDIGYLVGDYPEKTRDVSDICSLTGLSEPAANALIDENDGYRDDRLKALNFLLTSTNFKNALHELVQFKEAEKEAAILENARLRSISKVEDISEYHPNLSFLDLIFAQRQEATLCEYNLSKHFTFVIEELKRIVDEEVLSNG